MQQTELWANSTARRNKQIYWDSGDCNTRLSESRGTAGNNLWPECPSESSPHVSPSAGRGPSHMAQHPAFTGTQETCREQHRAEQVLSWWHLEGEQSSSWQSRERERLRGQSECSGWDVGEKTPGPNPLLVLVLAYGREPTTGSRLGHVWKVCAHDLHHIHPGRGGWKFHFFIFRNLPRWLPYAATWDLLLTLPAHGGRAGVAGPSHPGGAGYCPSRPGPSPYRQTDLLLLSHTPSHCYHYHHVHPTRMPFVAGGSHPEFGRTCSFPWDIPWAFLRLRLPICEAGVMTVRLSEVVLSWLTPGWTLRTKDSAGGGTFGCWSIDSDISTNNNKSFAAELISFRTQSWGELGAEPVQNPGCNLEGGVVGSGSQSWKNGGRWSGWEQHGRFHRSVEWPRCGGTCVQMGQRTCQKSEK